MAVDKTKYLSKKLQSMSESATLKMAQKARDLRAQGKDVISLSIGQPDFDTPEHIKAFAKKALDDGYTKYTNPGDEVIIFTPYWVSYNDIVRFAGGTPVFLKAGIEKDFKVTPDQLDAAINPKTKIILFSSPCNPTGSVYSRDELQAIAQVIDKYDDLFVVSDEIYEHINFLGKHTSIGEFDIVKDQTITVNGFSKGFAMTGWRLGYMGAPEWLAKACAKVQGQFTSGANAFGQKAAAEALSGDMGPTHDMKAAFLRRKQLVLSLISDIPGITCNDPDGAFYIFPNISKLYGKSNGLLTINNSNDFSNVILSEAHVAIVAGEAFGDNDCFRLSYAASDEQLIEAMGRIKEVLQNFH